jgi:Helicase associated domain
VRTNDWLVLQSDRARRLQQVDFFASLTDRHRQGISPDTVARKAGPKNQSVKNRRQTTSADNHGFEYASDDDEYASDDESVESLSYTRKRSADAQNVTFKAAATPRKKAKAASAHERWKDKQWNDMFDQLRAYYEEHGDCKIPLLYKVI